MSEFGYVQVILIILEIGLAIGATISCAKTYKHMNYYPIKQLSPLITVFQGFSFYVYQLMLAISFFGKVQISWEECQSDEIKPIDIKDKIVYLFISFLYLLARGCCFTFTFAKSFRIILTFNGRLLQKENIIIRICQSERLLIIFSFIYALLSFPLATIITSIYKDLQMICWLQIYENNYGLIYFTSLIEEIFTLYLIMKKKDHFRINDKLMKLTLQLQCIFMAWIATNSLLADFFRLINVIWVSCWIRSLFMFCYCVLLPLKQKEMHPAIYITTEKIENFQGIISKQFNGFFNKSNYCYKLYLEYLKYLDNKKILFQTVTGGSIENYELFLLFEKIDNQISSGENHFNGGDKMFQIISANKQLEAHFYKKRTSDIQGELFNYFNDIFEDYFKKTRAFNNIQDFYFSNDILQKNFCILNIELNQFQQPRFLDPQVINQSLSTFY